MTSEKASRDKQIDTLNEDIAKADENIAKLGKEKKAVEDNLQERTEQLQATEDKLSALNKAKNKVEGSYALYIVMSFVRFFALWKPRK